jgi:hypothetical protein
MAESNVLPKNNQHHLAPFSLFSFHPPGRSRQEPEQQKAERDKATHDYAVSPFPRRDLADEGVQAGDLARGERDAPVDVGEGLALHGKVLLGGVRLRQHRVYHVVAIVDAAPLVQHVLGLGGLGVAGPVGVNVGPDVGEQVGAVARLAQVGPQARQVPPVLHELLAEQGEVVLLEGRRRQRRFRVEEPGQLGDDGFALFEEVLELGFRVPLFRRGLRGYVGDLGEL